MKLRSRREFGVLFLVIAIYGIVSIIEPRFFSYAAFMNIMLFFPYLLVVAIGEMLEVVSRNPDISVGSILGFSAVVVGMTYRSNPGLSLGVAFLIAILVGMGLGLVNGVLVTWLKLPSVIVTLGTMNLFRGLMFLVVGARQIDNSFIPREVVRMSQARHSVVGIPYTVLIAIAVVIVVSVFINRTRLGREIYAVGNNPEAARLRGININRVKILVFVVSGMLCGVGAMIYISRIGYINPVVAGLGLEFTAIAAVVIGGTSMKGGIGTPVGTLLGCFLLGIINNAISMVGVSGFWREAIYGFIVIVAIVLDRYYQLRLENELLRETARRKGLGGEIHG